MNSLVKIISKIVVNALFGGGVLALFILGAAHYLRTHSRSNYDEFPKQMFDQMEEVDNQRSIWRPVGRERNYAIYPIDVHSMHPYPVLVGQKRPMYVVYDKTTMPLHDLFEKIPPIHPKHVNKEGYVCGYLCVNSNGKVVGFNPEYLSR